MSRGEGQVPPSEGRIAAAYREGRFPTSELLVAGLLLLLAAGALAWFGGRVVPALATFFRDGVTSAVGKSNAGDTILDAFGQLAGVTLPLLGLLVGVGVLAASLPALAARRRRGETAVPLPPSKPGRLPVLILRIFGGVVFGLSAVAVVRGLELDGTTSTAILTTMGRGASQMLAAAGGISVLVGIGEMILVRHLVWRSLFLDSREAQREQRAREGDPQVKREHRRRPRQEVLS